MYRFEEGENNVPLSQAEDVAIAQKHAHAVIYRQE